MMEMLLENCKRLGRFYSRRAKFALGLRLPRKELKVLLRGFCNVCGNDAQFSVTESPNLRESLYCSSCGSKARNRMLASGLLRIATAPPFQSIAALASASAGPKIFDTDCYGPIFQFLRKADFYSSSVYIARKPFGVHIRRFIAVSNRQVFMYSRCRSCHPGQKIKFASIHWVLKMFILWRRSIMTTL